MICLSHTHTSTYLKNNVFHEIFIAFKDALITTTPPPPPHTHKYFQAIKTLTIGI